MRSSADAGAVKALLDFVSVWAHRFEVFVVGMPFCRRCGYIMQSRKECWSSKGVCLYCRKEAQREKAE